MSSNKKVYVDEFGLDRLEYIRHMCLSQHRNAQSSKHHKLKKKIKIIIYFCLKN